MVRFVILAVLSIALVSGLDFQFDSDLDGWVTYEGLWRWADRQMIPNRLPASSNDGFAVFDDNSLSDEMFWPRIEAPNGAQVNVTFFAREHTKGTNNLAVQKTYDYLYNSETVPNGDLTPYIEPYNDEFMTVSIEFDPDPQTFYIGFFCYNAEKAEVGEWFQGCIIDSLNVYAYGPGTPEPTTPKQTTPEPTTPEPTTPEPTTTQEPTTPEPTTPEPTTPEPTTPEPTTTTKQPTTTPEPTTQGPTTLHPPGSITWNFQNGMAGWTLSHMNGAHWMRTLGDLNSPVPGTSPSGDYIIEVIEAEQYAATTLAQSPLLTASTTRLDIDITFWMKGSTDFPSELKVRKRTGIDSFADEPFLNLNSYGDKENPLWIKYQATVDLTLGENFVLILEGSLGGGENNKVYVSEIIIDGASLVDLPDEAYYTFEDGLAGFTSGNMDGGKWDLFRWSEDGGRDFGIPKPINGDTILVGGKFDIHSGMITIETPPINVAESSTKEITFKYWTRGSHYYPVALRMRIKTNGGAYAATPFVNLIDNGDVEHPFWISHTGLFQITELPLNTKYLQLVIEADLGSHEDNLLALDDLRVVTV